MLAPESGIAIGIDQQAPVAVRPGRAAVTRRPGDAACRLSPQIARVDLADQRTARGADSPRSPSDDDYQREPRPS